MNYLKAMFWTAVAVFLGIFVPALLGWLTAVQEAATTAKHLPDPSALGSAAIAGAAAGVSAAVTAGLVALRKQPWFPGQPPVYGTQPSGNLEG